MKRQHFLQTVSGTALGLAAVAGGWVTLRGQFRVRPVRPESCGKSFLAFCERARFATAEEAVQVTARRGQLFELFLDDDLSAAEVIPLRETKKNVEAPDSPLAQPRPDGRALDMVKTAFNRNQRLRDERALAKLSMNRSTGGQGRSLASPLDSSSLS